MGTFETRSIPTLNIDTLAQHVRFLIISLPNNELSKFSPFAIEKALKGIGGSPKTVKRLKSGDILIETLSATQTKSFLLAKKFLDHPVNVSVHRGLNSSRGVVSEKELVGSSDTEILEELSSQGVTAVRRINIKREGKLIPTKHIILTFNSTKLPSTIKARFLSCPVKPYIPNPIRCFNCQRFGHSKTVCRGKLTCSKCSVVGHSANDCTSDPKCRNCSQAHTADSKLCPQFKTEKKIQELRVRKNISYLEAKKLIPEQKSVIYAQTVKSCLPQSTQTVDYTTKIHCHTCCCQSVAPNQSHNKSSSSTTLNEQPSTSKVPSPVKSKTPGKSKNTDNSKQMKKAGKWETVKESKAAKRARILAGKRNQDSSLLNKQALNKQDFLKVPKNTSMENESDPPLKVYTSDDDDLSDMSTSDTDAPPPSSKSS
ncbi:hypothetical protein AVEN_129814-1 [Araneus ventricosus]|uniref:CCHC-type domain-containing protein n=1 Tax=Araneus ventricosus TaxID=182803 RepID=A0A4Y2X0S5_ARAVE|nr:hypothetical protein AVEN_129814-1 [Araneus ventricosus]